MLEIIDFENDAGPGSLCPGFWSTEQLGSCQYRAKTDAERKAVEITTFHFIVTPTSSGVRFSPRRAYCFRFHSAPVADATSRKTLSRGHAAGNNAITFHDRSPSSLHLIKHGGHRRFHSERFLHLVRADKRIFSVFQEAWPLVISKELDHCKRVCSPILRPASKFTNTVVIPVELKSAIASSTYLSKSVSKIP